MKNKLQCDFIKHDMGYKYVIISTYLPSDYNQHQVHTYETTNINQVLFYYNAFLKIRNLIQKQYYGYMPFDDDFYDIIKNEIIEQVKFYIEAINKSSDFSMKNIENVLQYISFGTNTPQLLIKQNDDGYPYLVDEVIVKCYNKNLEQLVVDI